MPVNIIGAFTFLAFMGYLMSLSLYPATRCRTCDAGKNSAREYGYAWKYCPSCAGTGRKPRLGARFFGI
jgi:hypothetical protein